MAIGTWEETSEIYLMGQSLGGLFQWTIIKSGKYRKLQRYQVWLNSSKTDKLILKKYFHHIRLTGS